MDENQQPKAPPERGTPKTLQQALRNGCRDFVTTMRLPSNADEMLDYGANVIHVHVKDFLSQKFTVAIMRARNSAEQAAMQELWKKILG